MKKVLELGVLILGVGYFIIRFLHPAIFSTTTKNAALLLLVIFIFIEMMIEKKK